MDSSSNKIMRSSVFMSNLTIRVCPSDRQSWRDKAKAAGMTLNRYITHVLNGTEIKSVVMAANAGQHPTSATTQPNEDVVDDVAGARATSEAQRKQSPIC